MITEKQKQQLLDQMEALLAPYVRSCKLCDHFDESGNCLFYGSRPPEKIIEHGCDDGYLARQPDTFDDDIPF